MVDRAQEFWPDIRDMWAAMLSAAPAAPQAAGVGEEWTSDIEWLREAARYFQKRDTKGEDAAFWSNLKNSENANRIADKLEALCAPSREPEGGAVDDDVRRLVIAARNVAFDTPTQSELRALDIASEAFASRVPWDDEPEALATREEAPAPRPELAPYTEDLNGIKAFMESEEAPAEAGESLHPHAQPFEQYPELALHIERMAMSGVVGSMISWDAFLRELNAALRTQPAREDAQPVWVDGVPTKHHAKEWFIAETTFGDRVVLTALPEEYAYDFKTADETYMKADRIKRWMPFPDSQYLFPHPAPDALRDALADLTSWFTKPVQGQNGMVWVIPAGERGADDAVNAALAALQAEQKGGAA